MRGLKVQPMTLDDTVENLSKREIFADEDRGKLIRAVGISNRLEYSLRTGCVRVGDCFFLCANGVYHYVTEKQLHDRLWLGRLLSTSGGLVECLRGDVERNGSGDNYSLIFVKAHM